jgi:hypothetical protein
MSAEVKHHSKGFDANLIAGETQRAKANARDDRLAVR